MRGLLDLFHGQSNVAVWIPYLGAVRLVANRLGITNMCVCRGGLGGGERM